MKALIALFAVVATCFARPGYLAGGIASLPSAQQSVVTAIEQRNLAARPTILSYAAPSSLYSAPTLISAGPQAVRYSAQSVFAAPITTLTSQFHTQDELGRYSYGYSGGPSAKVESRGFDGATGGFSYVDSNGILQSAQYVSDPVIVSAPPAVSYSAQTVVASAPVTTLTSQYHTQDELGRYSYGYSGGPSAKVEARGSDGSVAGGFSYVDANGVVQSAQYVSDAVNGFRVSATNLPVAPAEAPLEAPQPVEDTPEVAEAKAAHAAAVAEAAARAADDAPAPPSQEAVPQPASAPAEARAAPAESQAASTASASGYANIVIGPGGVPLETPEVAAARAADTLAHIQAKAALFG